VQSLLYIALLDGLRATSFHPVLSQPDAPPSVLRLHSILRPTLNMSSDGIGIVRDSDYYVVTGKDRMERQLLKQAKEPLMPREGTLLEDTPHDEAHYSASVCAVVISLPGMVKNKTGSWDDGTATVLWTERPVPEDSSGATELMAHKEHVRLPAGVKMCDEALIACTVWGLQWDLASLLAEILVRGYGGAVFQMGYQPPDISWASSIMGVHQIDPPDTPTDSNVSGAAKDVWNMADQSLAPSGVKCSPIDLATTYTVCFPSFRRAPPDSPGSERCRIVVTVQRPYPDSDQKYIRIPRDVEQLLCRTVELQHSHTELRLERLVMGLIRLGYATHGFESSHATQFPPWTLPDGSIIRQIMHGIYPGPGQEVHDMALIHPVEQKHGSLVLQDFQMQLALLELQIKRRHLFVRQNHSEDVDRAQLMLLNRQIEDLQQKLQTKAVAGEQQHEKLRSLARQDVSQAELIHLDQWNMDLHPILEICNTTSQSPFSIFGSPMSYVHSIAQSPMSVFGSPASFMTANSPASFMTARSTYTSPAMALMNEPSPVMRIQTIREDEPPEPNMSAPLKKLRNDYYDHLHEQNIIQPFDKEVNWSGKGQHVTFLPKDSVPLTVLSHLGSSLTATVDKVLCRRIALARKTMKCSRQWTIADALREVYHLQNLRHSHIVQLVGSYLQGRNFSILMYPVADCHLGTFLEDTADMLGDEEENFQIYQRTLFLRSSLSCLASAIAYIHEQTTKHMDIKPQNILVRKLPDSRTSGWRIYLADFGLSRSFATQGHSQTDGPTSRTPRYCAPEVYHYEHRGRSADIFSLGCVFTEILSACSSNHPQEFADYRRGDSDDESFHANLPRALEWVDNNLVIIPPEYFVFDDHTAAQFINLVKSMIDSDPGKRPTARAIQNSLAPLSLILHHQGSDDACCSQPPEPYVSWF
jgi:serine/threonine protein kinase